MRIEELIKKTKNKIRRDRQEFGLDGGFKKKYNEFNNSGNYYLLKLFWLYMLIFEKGVSADDFFVYHLYEKSKKERSEFVSLGKSRYIINLLNGKCKRELVEDKAMFVEKFSNYLLRNSISSNSLSYEKFKEFYMNEGRIIVKPSFGCNGKGIFIIEKGECEASLKKYYEMIKKEPYVLETVLVQDGILRELNPQTLNTFRVNVLNNNGNMKIVNAILRSGQGGVVTDNICAGGCVAEIDVDTGEVISSFVDLSNHIYEEHPLTKTVLKGKVVPVWEQVKEVVYRATELLDGGVYVSWDVAVIAGNKVAIVEGNTYGNFNIQQVVRQKGVWSEYKQFIKEWRISKKDL